MSLRAAKPLALRGTERGRGFYAACRASPGQRPGPGHQPRERWFPTSCSGRGAGGACPHHGTCLVPAASLCGDGDTQGQPGMGPTGSPLPLGGFGTALGFGIAVVGPHLAWSGAPSPARPELAPLQTAGGCQRGIGQHRLAPDCHPARGWLPAPGSPGPTGLLELGGETLGRGKPATETACGQRLGLGSAQEGGRGKAGPGAGVSWLFSSHSSTLPAQCPAEPSSGCALEDREQRGPGSATPDKLLALTGWDPNLGLIRPVNYKINPLPPSIVKRAAGWTCIFLALQNKAPELKNKTDCLR